MLHAGVLILLFLTDGVSSSRVCTYQDVLNHLNLTRSNELYTLTRPVLDHRRPTVVQLDLVLYAILAIVEKSQTFIPFIWIEMIWKNEHISWDPSQFCGIKRLSLPKEMLWRPDLCIYEMTDKNEAPRSPYLYLSHEGKVSVERDMKVVSTCKLDVHRFPFDTQSCNITVGSDIYPIGEVQLDPVSNSTRATQFSRQVMQTQGEWDFLKLSVSKSVLTIDQEDWQQIAYTITMKRKPLLHVINFLLPILFFLFLDMASFLISDHRGEKLGFKVTVLLAISVLLLILHEILPSMSHKTPLIATYCIVIFALLLLSLLETVLVTHLMEWDSVAQETKGHAGLSLEGVSGNKQDKHREMKCAHRKFICDVSGSGTPNNLMPVDEEAVDCRLADSYVLLLILEQLKEVVQMLPLFLRSKEDTGTRGYWTRVARRIHVAFTIFYLLFIFLFLTLISIEWHIGLGILG